MRTMQRKSVLLEVVQCQGPRDNSSRMKRIVCRRSPSVIYLLIPMILAHCRLAAFNIAQPLFRPLSKHEITMMD